MPETLEQDVSIDLNLTITSLICIHFSYFHQETPVPSTLLSFLTFFISSLMAAKTKKSKSTAVDAAIPLARPTRGSPSEEAVDDIPEDEKLRLLSQSGLLSKIPQRQPTADEPTPDFADELFFTATYAIPMTFLYFCMDV